MSGIVIIGAIVAVALIASAARPRTMDGMEDTPIAASQIRRGVENHWYTCVLVYMNGTPAVHLSGKTADGKPIPMCFR